MQSPIGYESIGAESLWEDLAFTLSEVRKHGKILSRGVT